ncbi:hypothetical protein M1247_10330 [Mycobacterium sp. 21AC1]|uniref:hypothetical protein n=1 Tax=[Mycobacterium] appelbergii TaxID=2939269 RepID=UPI002938F48D|nr:hypothetical protein [Mycobacterium sp. 21AC1]MDV3125308.1 hypothetical protein [Mycobacterium sp. 21AC1]
MTTIARRAAAGFTLAAAPVLIFLGAANAQAEPAATHTGPTATHHDAFPHQHNFPKPGTAEHHHHQRNHAK